MDSTVQLTIYIAFAVMSIAIIAYSLIKLRKKRLTPSMIIMVSMMLIWQTILISGVLVPDVHTQRILFDLKLPFIALTMVSVLLFIMRFYSMDAYITPYIVLTLCVIPAFTIIMAFTTNEHSYLRHYLAVFSPEFHFEAREGMWYWVHTSFGYFITVLSLTLVIVQHKKTPRSFRSTSRLLLFSMFITIVFNLLFVSDLVPFPVDPTFLSMSIIELLLFIVTINNQGIEFLLRARNDIFNRLTGALFILDTDSGIISKNKAGAELLRALGLAETERSFGAVLAAIGRISTKNAAFSDEEDGTDYYITLQGKNRVLNRIQRVIFDNTQKEFGTFAIFTDVTENRALIEKLEKKAGRDTLTGLYNRRHLAELRATLDTPESLPLTVLAGDLNGLKLVNDSRGHRVGDMFIRLAANTLLMRCPPSALVARMGGDEFLALIPNFPSQSAAELVSDIKKRMKNRNYFEFEPSIALGFAVKNKESQDLDELITIADKAMYADKALFKE